MSWTWQQLTYPDQDTLALEVDVGDGELAGERHVCGVLRWSKRSATIGRRKRGRVRYLEKKYGNRAGDGPREEGFGAAAGSQKEVISSLLAASVEIVGLR